MTPYRQVRYHLNEWATSPEAPSTPQEIFNLRHAQLRVRAEIGIGLLKGRFRVLARGLHTKTIHNAILCTVACGHMHNFIQNLRNDNWRDDLVSLSESLRAEVLEIATQSPINPSWGDESAHWRDSIAANLWDNFVIHHHDQEDLTDAMQPSQVEETVSSLLCAQASELSECQPSQSFYA